MAMMEFKNISIEFPGVKALDDVCFGIEKGQVMALCGENGAGKSTLGKIIAGVYPYGAYQGKVIYKGEELRSKSTLDAEKKGISIVHQELNLVYDMTVAENIFLGNMPNRNGIVDYKALSERAAKALESIGLDINPKVKLSSLTVSKMQMVEIAKAVVRKPDVLIFDEATSSLTDNEVSILFKIIRQLKKQGVTMIYVSHKLDEVFEICDSVTVLKDGCFVKSAKIEDVKKDDVIRWMIGRELKDMYPERPTERKQYEEIFKVENWNVYDKNHPNKKIIDNASFSLGKGEILGIYGLVGAGRTELVSSIFEGNAIKSTGDMWLENKKVNLKNSSDSIRNGISMATEDRKKTGLVLTMSVKHNISLATLRNMCKAAIKSPHIVDKQKENQKVLSMVEALKIKIPDIDFKVTKLSGGNQQKVVLSKWLLTNPKVLILDEPTRGIDVGTKAEIYKILRELASKGMAIIMISSELPEILGVTDRILVMKDGRVVGEINSCEANEEIVVRYAMGGVKVG